MKDQPLDGRVFTYEDEEFTAGDSPRELEITDDLGRAGRGGTVICDGPGGLRLERSDTPPGGVRVYGGGWTVRAGETLKIVNATVHAIKVVHTGTDTGYRIVVW